jgi:molybdopterin/thiamine biosynthesis adenylyltransferase
MQPGEIRVAEQPTLEAEGDAVVTVGLNTAGLLQEPNGLQLRSDEEFVIRIGGSPLSPPSVDVKHLRFIGFPHVLQGRRLCLFLDPSREWHPSLGMAGFLNRLWGWLADAAGDRFDPKTSMYHAVGGILHQSVGTPTIVFREGGLLESHQVARLVERSPHRLDLTFSTHMGGLRTPVFRLDSALPLGASSCLVDLLSLIDNPYLRRGDRNGLVGGKKSDAFVSALAACALRNPEGSAQYFVLCVPHPGGGAPHLLGGRLPSAAAEALRDVARNQGTAITLDTTKLKNRIDVEWCRMSDERHEVTTRRDQSRPVSGFLGKSVHVWGCGGLGSWIAEFVARAGVARITLCDPGVISGGLLVRQNYAEGDVGLTKAEALAVRVQDIRDDLSVEVASGAIPESFTDCLAADIIIDATVSNAITQVLDVLAAQSERKAIIAQVATDAATGTLGLLNVCTPGSSLPPSTLDDTAGLAIKADADLEAFHKLWQEPEDGAELIPTRGCSVPTFHGSAADLAAVAAVLTSLLGKHMQSATTPSGTHVISLPHAANSRPHVFLPLGAA